MTHTYINIWYLLHSTGATPVESYPVEWHVWSVTSPQPNSLPILSFVGTVEPVVIRLVPCTRVASNEVGIDASADKCHQTCVGPS